MIISGLVLTFGAIGEYLEEHGRLPRWIEWPNIVFIIMVVAGLLGEFFSDAGVFIVSRHLQTISDIEFTGLNKEAGLARKDAGAAIERAGKADERSQTLRKENLVLEREVAMLQQAASWRNFTKAQSDKLFSLAKVRRVFIPTFTLAIDSVVGNPEAKRYGGQLAVALSDALELSKPLDSPLGLSTCLECTGVWVCVNDNALSSASNDGKTIREMLSLSGVKGVKFCTDPKNGQGTETTIKIIVGPKE